MKNKIKEIRSGIYENKKTRANAKWLLSQNLHILEQSEENLIKSKIVPKIKNRKLLTDNQILLV